MENPAQLSSNSDNTGVQTGGFPLLNEQIARLEKEGVNVRDPSLWHPNVLLAAADLMGLKDSRASAVNRNASMLVASLLTLKNENSEPAMLEVRHADGAKAKITLSLSRAESEGDGPASGGVSWPKDMSSPTAAEKRVWVARESVDSKHIEELVHAMARAAGSIPGELVSLVGAGAILACVQSMETMNVAKTTFGFEGLGDDEYSFEFVGLEVVIEPSPSPAPTRTRSRPAI